MTDFADHLNAWCARHGYTSYRAAEVLGVAANSVRNWRSGRPCLMERAMRALMAEVDRGT